MRVAQRRTPCASLATLLLSYYLVASKLVLHEVPVFIATFVRLVSALVALSGYLWVRRIRVPRIGLRDAGVVTTQAGLGIMLFSVLALYGLRFTGAIESGVVLSMVPVVTSLTACIVFREHLSRMSVGGILIAVGGVCAMTVLSAGNGSAQANEHSVPGMGLLFGAVICETVFLTFGKLLSKPLAPPVLSWLLCAIGALMVALPAGVEWRGMSLGAVSWRSWALLVYSGVAVNSVAVVLMEYLRRFKPHMCPTEAELHAVRFAFDPAPPLETLMLHFCGEIRLNHWYRRAAEWHTEPVIKAIDQTISHDETRHGGAYLRYMKKALTERGQVARAAFAKIGVLMASARRTEKPLHPPNLHVNQALFPRDTIQSRLPDPEWLERWLDEQICFDAAWEKKVVERILHNLSMLFEQPFGNVQALNRFRKGLDERAEAGGRGLPVLQ